MKRFIFAILALFILTSLAPAAGCAFSAFRVKNVFAVRERLVVKEQVIVRENVVIRERAAIVVPDVQVTRFSATYLVPYYAPPAAFYLPPPNPNAELAQAIQKLTEATLQNQQLLQQLRAKP